MKRFVLHLFVFLCIMLLFMSTVHALVGSDRNERKLARIHAIQKVSSESRIKGVSSKSARSVSSGESDNLSPDKLKRIAEAKDYASSATYVKSKYESSFKRKRLPFFHSSRPLKAASLRERLNVSRKARQ